MRLLVLQAEAGPAEGRAGVWLCTTAQACDAFPTVEAALRKAERELHHGHRRLHLLIEEDRQRIRLLLGREGRAIARIVAVGSGREAAEAIASAFRGTAYRPQAVGQLFLAPTLSPRQVAEACGGGDERRCALAAAPSRAGAALMQAIAALQGRRIDPARREEAVPAPFYVAERARPWFVPAGERRLAALHLREGSDHLHILLEEGERPAAAHLLDNLVPLGGADEAALMAHLAALEEALAAGEPFAALREQALRRYTAASRPPYTLALVAEDEASLAEEVERARKGVPRALRDGGSWQTPRGSAFTAHPTGGAGIALVYPGAFNSYVGMGADLFLAAPDLHERLHAYVRDVGGSLADRLIFPRWARLPDEAARNAAAARLAADGVAMIESGTLLALAHTLILKEDFGLRPDAAMGYSLGEVSMLWANGVWRDGDAGSAAWRASPLFREELFGPKRLLQRLWGEGTEWATWIVKAPREAVEAVVAEEARLFLTIVNLPDEVVIAGEAAACRRAIERLQAHALRVPFDAVIHAPPAERAFADFVALYDHETHPLSEPRFYSAASDGPLVLERRALAETMATMSCRPLDFPRLVERLYGDGVRLFVEVGAQATCTRWIGRVLRGREHAVRALDRPGRSGTMGLASVVAMLLAHGVPLRLPVEAEEGPRPPTQALADYARNLERHTRRLAEAQHAFLEAHGAMMRQTASLLQAIGARHLSGQEGGPRRAVRFDEQAIREFARGDPERCFGPLYAPFRGRRVPRLPNGDLLLMDRVIEVEGEMGRVAVGASLTSEYDVAPDAWFLRDNGGVVPYAVVMEMALQPCGFLAAYLGSTLPYPDVDFYFRNLDGSGYLHHLPDLRGKRVVNRAELLGHTATGGTIIQRYRFALRCEGRTFYEGEATFGYFTRRALEMQKGIDRRPPWHEGHPREGESRKASALHLPGGHLRFLDKLHFAARGGEKGLGCVHAEGPVHPDAWFFDAHFYQDPVMPGSLGVEAMHQALAAFAQWRGLGRKARPATEHRVVWRYRGQLTPSASRFRVEVSLDAVTPRPRGGWLVQGEGSLWLDERRLYAVAPLALIVSDE